VTRSKSGLALGIVALGLAACSNGAGPGAGGTGGSSGSTTNTSSHATGGTASSSTGGTTSAGGSPASGGSTSTSEGATGGSTNTAGSATGGTTVTSSATGGTASAGSSSASGGTTSTSSSVAGGTTSTSSATGGSSGGTPSTGGSATNDSGTDAGADVSADGAGGLPDAGRDGSADRDATSDTRFDGAADRASDALASNCTCLGKPAPECTPTGHLSYTLSQAPSPTADQADAYKTITCAMDMAVAYYNCYANITGSIRVSYDTGVATADGNINGSIRFGAGRQYMTCATSMHEIAHTQGIGTASQWAAHVSGGLFVGTNAAAQLQAINATLAKPLYTELHADGMHFWPYGLNYDTEATGTDILVDHCQMVVAIRKDLGL
jgi:stress-induced morphogen